MTQRHSADIKNSHFLAALGLATILHLAFLNLVSLAPRQSTEEKPTIIRIDLAALGEPEEVEEVRALPPNLIPKPIPEVEPPLYPQTEPVPRPIPESEPLLYPHAAPELEPVPEIRLPPPPQPEPASQRPRKGIAEGVLEGKTQNPGELSRYLTKLFRMIDAKKTYPSQSLRW
ncbi:MAG: hypothetical protein ACE5G5_12620, partial [Candidatus Methylomirabilales bacterium]